ncbi:hypothetical protein D3C81_1096440 [compost metagenome]
MDQADHGPVDDQGRHHQAHQQLEGLARHEVVDHHAGRGGQRREAQRRQRDAALVDLEQRLGRIALPGQAVQHAAVAIHAAVVDRQRRGQHHHVQHVGNPVAVQRMEDQHERAATGDHVLPRVQRQQHRQRAHVEDQDAVDHLVGGLGNGLLGRIRFRRGNAHQLQPAEREHDHRHGHHQAAHAVGEEAAVLPQVGHAGLRAGIAGHQQVAAKADHADDGRDLDDGEPELHLAERLHAGQVDHVDQHEERQRGDPRGQFRPPVLHVDAHGRQFGHAHQDVEHPVVPAGHEAGEVAAVFIGEVAEGAGDGLVHHHLAELAHDEERHDAGDRVAQQDRRSRHLDGLGDAQEKAGADGAAQRDQLDMPVLQATLERAVIAACMHSVVSSTHSHGMRARASGCFESDAWAGGTPPPARQGDCRVGGSLTGTGWCLSQAAGQ